MRYFGLTTGRPASNSTPSLAIFAARPSSASSNCGLVSLFSSPLRSFTNECPLYSVAIRALAPHFPTIVYSLGLSGFGGLTTLLSLFLDMFRALTLHVSLSYSILTRLLSYQFAALSSLWNLFRGEDVCAVLTTSRFSFGSRQEVQHVA